MHAEAFKRQECSAAGAKANHKVNAAASHSFSAEVFWLLWRICFGAVETEERMTAPIMHLETAPSRLKVTTYDTGEGF